MVNNLGASPTQQAKTAPHDIDTLSSQEPGPSPEKVAAYQKGLATYYGDIMAASQPRWSVQPDGVMCS